MPENAHSFDPDHSKLEIRVRKVSHKNSYDYTSIHRHEYFEFILFESGNSGEQIIDFKEYTIQKNSLFIVCPNQVHLMNRVPSENGVLVQFTRDFLTLCIAPVKIEYLISLRSSSKTVLTNEQFQKVKLSIEQIKNELNLDSEYKYERVKHLFGFFFFEILDLLSSPSQLANNNSSALDFLIAVESNLRETRNVKDLADKIGVPVNKLTQEVKVQFNKTPLQLIHDATLVEIKRLLVVEKLSHKEIAFKLNFDSQSSYSRFIKQKTSLTPGELKDSVMKIAQQ